MAQGTTDEQVAKWLGLKAWTPGTDAILTAVVASTNAYVAGLPAVAALPAPVPPATATDWPADLLLGTTMLAARYYRRRNSASGVEAITESGAQYVSRWDSDIARLLRIDAFDKPQVG